jgi:hypothetical protein
VARLQLGPVPRSDPLDRPGLLYDQDTRFADRVSDMLISGLGDEKVAGAKTHDMYLSILPPMHIDLAIKDDKRFSAVVGMPTIWFVSPMQAHAGALDFHQVPRPPGAVRSESADVRDDLGDVAKMGALRQVGKAGVGQAPGQPAPSRQKATRAEPGTGHTIPSGVGQPVAAA